ncbi:hypothetical protein JN535_08570 [Cellulosimicrobium cellulans]|uniref:hypothetical protein n=1 Tax=Cellulosimicrobium cellulans TaxID=1710 RepID=UPI0019654E04|nr:hypothetical protein [Cellulosimicrobium cellulans]MBN0040219.1 hypothetical protein [Cellulosimicrobium cellulans]
MSTAQIRTATVVDPGVIVSTISDADQAQTVIFRADPNVQLGYTTEVWWDTPVNALVQHETAIDMLTGNNHGNEDQA